jgi:hypothetical protein
MAGSGNEAPWSGSPSMDPVHEPRRTTKADCPKLLDRIEDVWKGDSQHRSAWEVTVYVVGVIALMLTNSFIWGSGSGTGQKVAESVLTLGAVSAIATVALLKLRFRA